MRAAPAISTCSSYAPEQAMMTLLPAASSSARSKLATGSSIVPTLPLSPSGETNTAKSSETMHDSALGLLVVSQSPPAPPAPPSPPIPVPPSAPDPELPPVPLPAVAPVPPLSPPAPPLPSVAFDPPLPAKVLQSPRSSQVL